MQIGDLLPFLILLGLAALVASTLAYAMDKYDDTLAANSYASNISDNGQKGLANTTAQFGTVGTIAGIVILVGLVLGAFAFAIHRR